MAYESNKHFHNSEDFIVKTFDENKIALISDTDNSETVVNSNSFDCFKPM